MPDRVGWRIPVFFGKHGFQLDANHVSTSLFFTISHLPENCNAFRKNIYEKCCFTIDIQRNSLYNIDIERRLRGAREQHNGGDAQVARFEAYKKAAQDRTLNR